MTLRVLIHNYIAVFVNVYAFFILHGGLTLITLNKQINSAFVDLRASLIRFNLCLTNNLKLVG